LVQDTGLNQKVHFAGFLPNAAEYMKQFDAFVISSDREGFPYVLVESLLNKVPVISTDVSDIKEIIGPDYIVDVGDVSGLADKMKQMVNSKHLTISYHQVFEFAERTLTVEAMLSEVKRLYRHLHEEEPS
jgi:glycosyltransferase involved in cell wall biosynthesis